MAEQDFTFFEFDTRTTAELRTGPAEVVRRQFSPIQKSPCVGLDNRSQR